MLYFANPTTPVVRDAIAEGVIGAIATPAQHNPLGATWQWCADNGCFGKGYPGDAGYLKWLDKQSRHLDRCVFATIPDVVADAGATLDRFQPMCSEVASRGYKPALVAQDGLENLPVPWDEFTALFIGGSTDFKLGESARTLAAEAKRRGKWLHMGRVNSLKRLRYAKSIGCDSVDGTYLTFGPTKNLARLTRWLRMVNEQESMFTV